MTEKDLNIPTPTNLKRGDDFYDKTVIGTASQTSMLFEPEAELIDLPSHGYLYKEITKDPDILKGQIRVRPMTVHEEKILATSRLIKSGQALDMVFRNVIKSQIDPVQLLSSDRVFIMLWLRNISYGNIYKFKIQCQNAACQKKFEMEVDLNNYPIREIENPEIKEPFELVLPKSNAKLYYRLPRGIDEIEMAKLQNQPKKINEVDEMLVKRLSSVILKIELSNGAELPLSQKDAFIDSLIGKDSSIFKQSLEKNDCGIEEVKGIICPHCEYEFDTTFPITESFFRYTE